MVGFSSANTLSRISWQEVQNFSVLVNSFAVLKAPQKIMPAAKPASTSTPRPNKWKRDNPIAQEAALRGGLIGSPETLRRKLRRFRTSHIDQVILLNQAGKNSHQHICESLELFAREVIPEFRQDREHEEWKAGVMSGAIKLQEIDTAAFTDRYGKLGITLAPVSGNAKLEPSA